jgi:hypothetical protein
LRHNAAAIDAAEEQGVGDDPSQVATATGRGAALPNPLAALLTPAHTELSDERVRQQTRSRRRFDPVRVFLGPAPGWKGPVLGPIGRSDGRTQDMTVGGCGAASSGTVFAGITIVVLPPGVLSEAGVGGVWFGLGRSTRLGPG